MVKHWKKFELALLLLMAAAAALGAGAYAAGPERATLIREASLYASAGSNGQRLSPVGRGSGLTILERSNADGQPW
ncbi:MAG TPA: hypothetical protein VNB54_09345 [Alphaproteobacteria bacterium]|nr:hypothetical protein [Alphaproteobacteria bacterium]